MFQPTSDNMVVEFIENNLSPTEDERKQIGRRYEDLSTMLKGVIFQSGSYARFTAITPVNDLDVIWEVDQEALKRIPDLTRLQKSIDPIELDVSNLLNDLAERLKKNTKTSVKHRESNRKPIL